MSLFAGLFKASGNSSSLFSDRNAFRSTDDTQVARNKTDQVAAGQSRSDKVASTTTAAESRHAKRSEKKHEVQPAHTKDSPQQPERKKSKKQKSTAVAGAQQAISTDAIAQPVKKKKAKHQLIPEGREEDAVIANKPSKAPSNSVKSDTAATAPQQASNKHSKKKQKQTEVATHQQEPEHTGSEPEVKGKKKRADGNHKESKRADGKKSTKKSKEVSEAVAPKNVAHPTKSTGDSRQPTANGLPSKSKDEPEDPNAPSQPSTSQPPTPKAKPKPNHKRGYATDSDEDDSSDADQEQQPSAKKPKLTLEEEAAKLKRTIFVGNLPPNIRKKRIQQIFTKYGAVESVRLRSVPLKEGIKVNRKVAVLSGQSDQAQGEANAYVVFTEESSVEAALEANMNLVEAHHIRVDRAAAPKGKDGSRAPATYDPVRSVFVGNLDRSITEDELIEVFSQGELEGQVEAVRVVKDPSTHLGKGFGFVLFKDKAAAKAALVLHDTPGKNRRPLRVMRVSRTAAPQSTGSSNGKSALGHGHRPSSPGQRQGEGPRGPRTADWQGAVTKGKGKKLRGLKPDRVGGGTAGSAGRGKGGKAEGRKRSDKRPAVAARKARQLATQGGVQKPKGKKLADRRTKVGGKKMGQRKP